MLYQKIFFNFLYPFYEGVFKKRKTFKFYKEYSDNLKISQSALKDKQFSALKNLLVHAYEQVPFYQKQWDEIGFNPKTLLDVKQLEQLPLLTKDVVRENYADMRAKSYVGLNITKTTGGSTGVPFKFEHDRENYDRRQGVTWRGYGWSGSRFGDRTLYFWGTAIGSLQKKNPLKDRLYNWFYNRKIVNVFSMSNQNINEYVDYVNSYKPVGIVSYTGPLYEIAKYILENNIKVNKVKWLISAAEPLFETQRTVIEQAFSAPLFNTYGCREFTLIAAECVHKNGLHINDDHLLVEITDDIGVGTSEIGNVVITDLYNYGMPLIRYVNGDVAQLKKERCACGLPMSQLAFVDGRRLDKIITKSGKMLPGEFFPHMLKDISGIEKFQVVQDEIDKITLKIVSSERFDRNFSEAYISTCLVDTIGTELEVLFQYVDDIPLTQSGKHRVTVSTIIDAL